MIWLKSQDGIKTLKSFFVAALMGQDNSQAAESIRRPWIDFYRPRNKFMSVIKLTTLVFEQPV